MNDLAKMDFLDEATIQSPFQFYDAVRTEAPVYRLPRSPVAEEDVWLVSSHALVKKVLIDWKTFSSRFDRLMGGRGGEDPEVSAIEDTGYPAIPTMLTEDPPAQRRYRALVTKAFSMSRVKVMEDYIRQICDELIDGFIDRGSCNFLTEFAIPLPIFIIADQIGIPRSDLPLFKRISDEVVAGLGRMKGRESILQSARARVELQHYFASAIESARQNPRDDIISELANTPMENGELLSMPEALSILQQILVAGNETTTSALAGGLVYIIDQAGIADRFLADPFSIPNAVEEILRLDAPTKHMWRIVAQDTELGGVELKAGSILLLSFDAANRDEAVFSYPEVCTFDRPNADKHLSFGFGIHSCVGAQLARKEMVIAFERLFSRLRDIKLAEGHPPLRYASSILHRGFDELNIVFSKN